MLPLCSMSCGCCITLRCAVLQVVGKDIISRTGTVTFERMLDQVCFWAGRIRWCLAGASQIGTCLRSNGTGQLTYSTPAALELCRWW